MILSLDAGQLPVSHILRTILGLGNVLLFTLNTALNKLNEIVNQPCYKIGCILDDFAQLLAKVSVPVMFKWGWAKLWCLVG